MMKGRSYDRCVIWDHSSAWTSNEVRATIPEIQYGDVSRDGCRAGPATLRRRRTRKGASVIAIRSRLAPAQAGFSLIETLISIALISIVLGAIAGGVLVSIRSSTSVNTAQRADVVLNSFSEAIKQLPYEACLDTAYYRGQYQKYENALRDAGRPVLSSATTSVEVSTVTHGGLSSCTSADGDPGVQEWTLKVTVKGRSRTAVVVKRNPSRVPPSGRASMQITPWSQVGDAQVGFGVAAVGSTAPVAIALYVYDCDTDSSDDDPVYVATDNNPRAACIYNAPADGSPSITKKISLTIIDTDGVSTTTTACAPNGGINQQVVSATPCTVRLWPQLAQPPEVVTPLVTTTTAPVVEPPVTTTTTPPGPAATSVSGVMFKSSGCCDTWVKLQFPALTSVTQYRVTLVWNTVKSVRFQRTFQINPAPTPDSTVTVQFQQIGLSLLEKYIISVEANISNTWGPPTYLNGGKATCLSGASFTLLGAEFCKLA